jgi:hypothetical protein
VSEPFVDRGPHRLAASELLADPLELQEVGVHRHTNREDEAGDAGERERRVERGEEAESRDRVEDQSTDGEHAREAIVDHHDQDDEREAEEPGLNPLTHRILPQARADRADFDDFQWRRQRAGAEHEREILRGLKVATPHRDLTPRADRALDDRRTSHHALVEHDRHVVADVALGL